jgi:Protein of unknown function (DUF4089)
MATPLTADQLDRVVHANAAALDLRIAIEHRPGVAAYFKLAADMAELVMGLPLDPDDESGAVFSPVAPEVGS